MWQNIVVNCVITTFMLASLLHDENKKKKRWQTTLNICSCFVIELTHRFAGAGRAWGQVRGECGHFTAEDLLHLLHGLLGQCVGNLWEIIRQILKVADIILRRTLEKYCGLDSSPTRNKHHTKRRYFPNFLRYEQQCEFWALKTKENTSQRHRLRLLKIWTGPLLCLHPPKT